MQNPEPHSRVTILRLSEMLLNFSRKSGSSFTIRWKNCFMTFESSIVQIALSKVTHPMKTVIPGWANQFDRAIIKIWLPQTDWLDYSYLERILIPSLHLEKYCFNSNEVATITIPEYCFSILQEQGTLNLNEEFNYVPDSDDCAFRFSRLEHKLFIQTHNFGEFSPPIQCLVKPRDGMGNMHP